MQKPIRKNRDYQERQQLWIAQQNENDIPYWFLHLDNYKEIFSEKSLRNMDTALLSFYSAKIAEREDIVWENINKEKFSHALFLSTIWHKGQTRRSGKGTSRTPYINHPMRNMLRAYQWGFRNSDILAAIVLHDVIEDSSDRIVGNSINVENEEELRDKASEIIEDLFSEKVKELILSVSNPIQDKKNNLSQEQRTENYIKHLENILYEPDVFIVKFSDYIDNAGGLIGLFDVEKERQPTNLFNKYFLSFPVFQDAYSFLEQFFNNEQKESLKEALEEVEIQLRDIEVLIKNDKKHNSY